jgi:hypothetical protein
MLRGGRMMGCGLTKSRRQGLRGYVGVNLFGVDLGRSVYKARYIDGTKYAPAAPVHHRIVRDTRGTLERLGRCDRHQTLEAHI